MEATHIRVDALLLLEAQLVAPVQHKIARAARMEQEAVAGDADQQRNPEHDTLHQSQHFLAGLLAVGREQTLEQQATVLVLLPVAHQVVSRLAVRLERAARAREEREALLLEVPLLRVLDHSHHPLVVLLVQRVHRLIVEQRVIVVVHLLLIPCANKHIVTIHHLVTQLHLQHVHLQPVPTPHAPATHPLLHSIDRVPALLVLHHTANLLLHSSHTALKALQRFGDGRCGIHFLLMLCALRLDRR